MQKDLEGKLNKMCPTHNIALELIGVENFGLYCKKPNMSKFSFVYKCPECSYTENWRSGAGWNENDL